MTLACIDRILAKVAPVGTGFDRTLSVISSGLVCSGRGDLSGKFVPVCGNLLELCPGARMRPDSGAYVESFGTIVFFTAALETWEGLSLRRLCGDLYRRRESFPRHAACSLVAA